MRSHTRQLLIIVISLFVLAGGFFVIRNLGQAPPVENKAAEIMSGKKIGRIGEGYFNFEIADTPAERTLGLSGREPLPDTDALLFVFDAADKHCFWMKDMKFNIDILWFDENRRLVYEKHDVPPSTYPESFCPDIPAKYVVEVAAGVAAKNQLSTGSILDIEL